MNLSRLISILLIVAGAFVAIYAQAGEKQNVYILILGIVFLMLGVYRISKNIPGKHERESEDSDNEQTP